MASVRRRLLNFLTLLSLLLCVAVMALWWLEVGYSYRIAYSHGIGQVVDCTDWPYPGFWVVWFPDGDRIVTYTWALPYWKLLALTAGGPFVWAYHRVRPRRPLPGPLLLVRLRPPRHARPLPRVRGHAVTTDAGGCHVSCGGRSGRRCRRRG
jgi:hypothetical protein